MVTNSIFFWKRTVVQHFSCDKNGIRHNRHPPKTVACFESKQAMDKQAQEVPLHLFLPKQAQAQAVFF
jgi:hypothetical protein